MSTEGRVERDLRPGAYTFAPGTPPVEVLDALQKGPQVPPIRVTLPEGWRVERMARRLAETGAIADAERFVDLCADTEFLEALGLPAAA